MAPIKSFGERIADALVEDGLLSATEVQELLEQQKKDGTRFIKLVAEKGKITDLDLVVSMGRVLNTPPINVARASIPIEIVDLLPRDIAVKVLRGVQQALEENSLKLRDILNTKEDKEFIVKIMEI